MILHTLLVLASGVAVLGQRPSFAGSRPIGYPELYLTTTQANGLGNRFGEGDGNALPLPLEAKGDRNLVERLSKLPIDQQPFWLINWKALEEQRKKPQTYPQRPSPFNDRPQTEGVANLGPNAGPIPNNGAVPLTNELANRNGGEGSTPTPPPGYHYPEVFSASNYANSQNSQPDNSGFPSPNVLSTPVFTTRPDPASLPPPAQPLNSQIPFTPPQPNTQIPFVGNRNSNDEVNKQTSSSGSFSATNAFQNGNSVFSNYNSVVQNTNSADPKGNTVSVQTSGAPPPDAPFQLTNSGVFVPNPAVMNTNGLPSIPKPNPAKFYYTINGAPVSQETFEKTYGKLPQTGVPGSGHPGGPGKNSSLVHSDAGFQNMNSVSKNATHYNSSYHNSYHYSYAFQNKYVIPHGGGAPVKVSTQNSNSGFPTQNGGIPNSNVQFLPSTAPQSNSNNQKRVVQTRSPPVIPNRRQNSPDYSYYDD